MDLHDFLARSLDLLTLLADLEQRQAAIAADLAEFAASSVDDPGRGSVLARVETEHRKVGAELDRAFALLAGF